MTHHWRSEGVWTTSGMRVAVAGELGHRDVSRRKVRNACSTYFSLASDIGVLFRKIPLDGRLRLRDEERLKLTLIASWCYFVYAVEKGWKWPT